MGQRPDLRDLRSLERRGLRAVFPPLDERERQPAEMLLDAHRQHRLEPRRFLRLGAALYLPGLVVVLIVLISVGVNSVVAFGVAGLLLAAVYAYALFAPNS